MARHNKKRSNGKSPNASTESTQKSAPNTSTESSKDSATGTQSTEKGSATNAGNDPEWYSKDAPLVIDSANLPYSDPIGGLITPLAKGSVLTYDTTGNIATRISTAFQPASVPGICTLRTKASFGTNRTMQDPCNVAAQSLYSHTRYMNSGRKNYDAPDEFIYVASMADIYAFITWVFRIYGKAFVYSQKNRYVGEALLTSEFINAQDIKLHLADLRYWINAYINKVSSYAVPADISYFQRRAWVYSNVYLENPDGNIKDQLYQFAPDGFYRFNLDSSGAGMLEYQQLNEILGVEGEEQVSITYDNIRTIGEWLLAHVTGDEDFGIMSGDIMKAFDGKIIGLSPLAGDYMVIPVYSEYVLLQMKNATVAASLRGVSAPTVKYDTSEGSQKEFKSGNLYQTYDGLIWSGEAIVCTGEDHVIISRSAEILMDKILDVNTPTPNPIDNMESSRLTLCKHSLDINSSGDSYIFIGCGSDIVEMVRFTDFSNVGAISSVSYRLNLRPEEDYRDRAFNRLWSAFTYAPHRYRVSFTDTNNISSIDLTSGVNNFAIVSNEVLLKMHEVAMLSLLFVPGAAKMVNVLSK